MSPKLKVSRAVAIPAGTHTRVYVTNGRIGLSAVEPSLRLPVMQRVSISNGVFYLTPLQEFKVLVGNV